MYVSPEVAQLIQQTLELAQHARFEYVTPELVLYVICRNPVFAKAFKNCGGNVRKLDYQLKTWLEENMETQDGNFEDLRAFGNFGDSPVKADGPATEEKEPEEDGSPAFSYSTELMLSYAWESAQNSEKSLVELPHLIHALYALPESHAAYYMQVQGVDHASLLREMTILCEEIDSIRNRKNRTAGKKSADSRSGNSPVLRNPPNEILSRDRRADTDGDSNDGSRIGLNGSSGNNPNDNSSDDSSKDNFDNNVRKDYEDGYSEGRAALPGDPLAYGPLPEDDGQTEYDGTEDSFWRQYAVCLNEQLDQANPLIGRQEELERTMQILCRREKNNPLHLGEPGVGKTAVTLGLARLLEDNRVPEPLRGAKIFSLDLGSLLAGTQYRGDFEKRFKKVMDSLCREEKPIVYIDEIHNIVGAGAVNGGTFDISNMLKPYLAAGHVRFIGATTYEEYKKHFEKNKSLVRQFQNIDIKEPDIQDTVKILEGLKETYEAFHGVTYQEGVLNYAAEMSARYITERFLPDKAIDLLDEAGAYRCMHPQTKENLPPEVQTQGAPAQNPAPKTLAQEIQIQEIQIVDRELIDEILSQICHIPKQIVEHDETETLATLEKRLLSRIYGQDEALSQVVNAVKFSRAGLLEEGKPLASLLFAGPTGVGKTEIARSLAEELGIRLIRFDMSEYEEKHAVAKLIGAPAGYVGYEEGGLLTEEIRRHPHAVLLLDEIEKAHPDIYNILLQVMDYATLTDNQGRKADFRNIILIMTSNAGASRMGKHGIGFQGQDVSAEVILDEVKRIFQPEFRNRLNRIVVFRSMDEKMAEQIVEKKLGELQKMLLRKNVKLIPDARAKKLLQKKGISVEFGAREIERVIQGEVKPLLVDEILFGTLKEGGNCQLTAGENDFRLCEVFSAGMQTTVNLVPVYPG